MTTLVSPVPRPHPPPMSLPHSSNPDGAGSIPQPPAALARVLERAASSAGGGGRTVLEFLEPQPAPPLDPPGRCAAPMRGCSPSRHRHRLAELHARDQGTPLQQRSNALLQDTKASYYNSDEERRVVPNIELAALQHKADEDRAHHPASATGVASCPVCGALRTPIIDIGAGETLHALDRRKAELQREIFRIELAIKQQKRAQYPDGAEFSTSAGSSPRLRGGTVGSGAAPTTPRAGGATTPRVGSHNSAGSAVRGGNVVGGGGARAGFLLSQPQSSLVMDLRATAESLMAGAPVRASSSSRGGGGASLDHHEISFSTQPQSQQQLQQSQIPANYPSDPLVRDRLSQSILKRPQQATTASEKYMSEEAAALRQPAPYDDGARPFRATANHTHRRASPLSGAAASAGIPNINASPVRDVMYSDDHRDTLKQLAVLRAEREVGRMGSGSATTGPQQ